MSAPRQFQRLAIIGLGLMGGSLGLAVKRRNLAAVVAGFARRPDVRQQALEQRVVDEVYDRPEEAVRGADLTVFCAAVRAIPDLIRTCAPHFAPHAVVTDVGSSKHEIVTRSESFLAGRGVRFVGSHPLTGSERQGLAFARPDLYENAVVVLTPSANTEAQALAAVSAFWKALGARPRQMLPEEHDRLLARTSHVPHMVAAMLAASVGRGKPEQVREFCGAGFMDTTRIAEGAPELWRDIIQTNGAAVLVELDAFQRELDQVRRYLAANDFDGLGRYLDESRRRRRRLSGNHGLDA